MTTIPIEVIVQDAPAPVVPGEDGTNTNTNTEATVAVPDTGSGMGNIFTGSTSSIVLPVVLLVLATGSIVAILIHKYHKQKKDKTSKKEKLAIAITSTIAVLAATVLIGNLVIPATKAAASDTTDTITPSEDKVSITVTRDSGVAEASIESTATITSSSDFGYKVLLSMAEGVETNYLYLNGDVDSEYYIASVEADNEEGVELADNTWGYALGEGTNYTAVPLLDSAATVAQGDEPVEDEALNIYYGVKVSSDLPAGTYSGGEIEYDLAAIEPTIGALTYMQDFAKLSESGKTSVLRSMPEGYQFTLKDSRDQKEYFISKLADGNVWMTQNLDLDIEEGRTYTYIDTDLPANRVWIPDRTTYSGATTTWNDDWPPANIDESYNPGDLYWNGEIVTTWNKRLEDMTEATGDEHYHIGNYYNWTAAVAMNSSEAYSTQYQDTNSSICPSSWRLPPYNGEKSYQNLVESQDLTPGETGNVHLSPVYFVYGGEWRGQSGSVGAGSKYWTSVASGAMGAYSFAINHYGLYPQDGGVSDGRSKARSVRCVVR